MNQNKDYAVPGILKAYEVINLVAEKGCVKYNTFRKTLDMPKTTLYVTLNTLLQGGYLRYTPKDGYSLGLKIFWLGNRALAQFQREILDSAKPLMDSMVRESKETSFLGLFDGSDAVIIGKTECTNNQMTSFNTGMPISIQTAVIGKALMAWQDEKTARKIIAAHPPAHYTERAILDPDEFIKHLENSRQYGFTMTSREATKFSACVAAPVFSKQQETPIAGISIAAPFERMTPEFFAFASERVHRTSKLLSEKLGASHYPEFVPMPYPMDCRP